MSILHGNLLGKPESEASTSLFQASPTRCQARATKCRLLYVVGQLGGGGLEHQLYLLLKTIDRERYHPQVVVWNYNPNDTYVSHITQLGVPLHYLGAVRSAPGKMLAFRRLVQKLKPEVIHSYSFYTNIAAEWAALGTKIIAVGGLRSNFSNDKTSCGVLLGSLCARWPSNQIYNNVAAAETAWRSRTVFTPRQIFVVQNAVDLQEFRSTPLPTDKQARIVCIGSLIQCKRWDRLVRAAATLKRRGLEFLVEISGDGPLRESLQQLSVRLEVADLVTFHGHIDCIPSLLTRSTFLAHTSDIEGCPNVVMEAMACGRPVVATDAGDIPFLVEDGKTGFVVRRGDDATLAERLARLILDGSLCRDLGRAGRLRAEQKFRLECLVSDTLATYQRLGWVG